MSRAARASNIASVEANEATLADLSFIETQFPVSKMSIESFRERTAKQGQTLTGLGKWWGRKPLVLCRATILGLLLPATDDHTADRDVFLRLMTMDEDGLLRRKTKRLPSALVHARSTPENQNRHFVSSFTRKGEPNISYRPSATPAIQKQLFRQAFGRPPKKTEAIDATSLYQAVGEADRRSWFSGTSSNDLAEFYVCPEAEMERAAFLGLPYNEKMEFVCRPEQVDGPSPESWSVINSHLGTTAETLPGLVSQLGKRRFGHAPRLGDSFCGGGSIPFEAARLGCETYGSDLNPVAGLLTWSALNLVGGGPDVAEQVQKAQRKVFDAVDRQIAEWGIEHNEQGWRADAFLYCIEVVDPESGWTVPLAPSWLIGERTRTVAKLIPDPKQRRFDIKIVSGASEHDLQEARQSATVKDYRLVSPIKKTSTPIESLSRDLRVWEEGDIAPRVGDVFQERLFCIRWVETYYAKEVGDDLVELSKAEAEALPDLAEQLESGVLTRKTRRHYRGVTDHDLNNEKKAFQLLEGRIANWSQQGMVPTRAIQRGQDINRPTKARGWSHWRHFFNPRQLLINGLFAEQISHQLDARQDQIGYVGCLLGLGRVADWNSRQSRWDSSVGNEKGAQTFYKPSLSTPLFNYCSRGIGALDTTFLSTAPSSFTSGLRSFVLGDARVGETTCDYWVTDPPYADAVNYHELSEYFLAWYEKLLPKAFPRWYSDSKRALAIKADNPQTFRESMVECYKRLASLMPRNGMQVVMFTHQDVTVWADLTTILWAAGLQVTAAWCIATETEAGGVKVGNYVQGTVLLVLRKQQSEETAFLDEVYNEVESEVRRQLDSMKDMDDASDPNFTDTDYQLAAYAAALRVLTSKKIEEIDVAYELTRTRGKGEKSQVEDIIDKAVKIACDHLVPKGIDTHLWKGLTAMERYYLKGLEIESHGEHRDGVYMDMARGFGVGDYRAVLASTKANQTRPRTPSEFGRKEMGDTGFGGSLVRHALFAACKASETDATKDSIMWLKTEVKDYASSRGRLIEILEFFAAFEKNGSMQHWHKDAHAAGLVAGAMRNREDNV